MKSPIASVNLQPVLEYQPPTDVKPTELKKRDSVLLIPSNAMIATDEITVGHKIGSGAFGKGCLS